MQNEPVTASELAEQRLNAARIKRDLAEASGGLLDAGFFTQNEVYRDAAQRRILAVEDNGQLRFPLCPVSKQS
jgi:hypothetical protein